MPEAGVDLLSRIFAALQALPQVILKNVRFVLHRQLQNDII